MSLPLPTFNFLGLRLLVTALPPIWLKRADSFFLCIPSELAFHADMDEFTDDAMGVAVDDRVSILIISFIVTFLLDGSFGFGRCGIFTLFLMLNFYVVDFCHKFFYF